MNSPPPPPEVAAAYAALATQARLLDLRDLIFAAAEATDTGPLTETLKWGQPSFLPAKKAGTTLRLGEDASAPTLFVPCSTNLLDRYRAAFPSEFTYSGARAVHLPAEGPFPDAAFQQIAAMALTYHRDKRR
ncbi:DUF1801 domain-containing protein [Jannaschia sp. CCS1]|uniref:DUF1801 domain-containing protein n=1 Tax=Jannaschia sp. (strain CCS1) TaxID=290400 RepID=UPI000053A97A|nr:DUF1801 domain-containing protein [Jannaschia sp. CCS1]ABD54504.1 hypothetical protein Jann_1587 [Jannaschia sp. CCS1]